MLDRFENGPFGDFVKDDAFRRVDREPQHFGKVPCDGLSFAVFIGGQPHGLLLGQLGQFGYEFFLVRRNFVHGAESLLDVDAQVLFGEVADVSVTRLDDVILSEKLLDGLGFGRRLDDD